jgi:hypothetical protein
MFEGKRVHGEVTTMVQLGHGNYGVVESVTITKTGALTSATLRAACACLHSWSHLATCVLQ